MRPLLRPGTHVLTRGDGQLQVGLDPRQAVVLPDSPEVRDALSRLDGSAAGDADPGTVDLLHGQGLLVDEGALLPGLAADQEPTLRHGTAALARRLGDRAPAVVRDRRASRVAVRCFGPPVASRLAASLVDLLVASAVPVQDPERRPAPVTVGVLLGAGEPDRDLLDPWTRGGTPYTLLRLTEGRARLGPFVVPGRTACLRCLDAHHTDVDPAWPLLVRQYATASARDRADGAPEPVDPALAALAVAWTARDLVTFLDGGRPSTWSATVTVDPDLTALETLGWHRHPECACSWE
jgi:bacteriocin biosynthesis cyclodehydratase domain-containing protein